MTQDQNMTDKGAPNVGNEPEKNHDDAAVATLLACDRQEILKECTALIVYISRHGDVLINKADDKSETEQQEISEVKKAYEELVQGVMTCNGPDAKPDDWRNLVMAYTKMTRFTYAHKGVNGRSVLDTLGGTMQIFRADAEKSHRQWFKPQHRPMWYAVTFLILALLLELFTGWAGRIDDPSTLKGYWEFQYNSIIELAHILVPALWGAIGACVFLMKRISDKLGMLAYEQSRQKGIETRILLGAILAVVSVEMMFPTHSQDLAVGQANLGPMGLAFIVGLAIKPIYGAFETLAQGIAERLSPKK